MSFVTSINAEMQAILSEGGSCIVALLALAFGIAFSLLALWNSMKLPDAPVLDSREWRSLLRGTQKEVPLQLTNHLNQSADPRGSLQEIGQRLFSKPERRFPFAFILISAAPLIGLLGTVSGMFSTFRGMAVAASAPIDVISDGISEALITTQTGLIIGVPTFIVCAWLKSRYNELLLRFQKLESRLLQSG
ncbi:MAG: MotA/TolQ/ExbB proton channel family protein [Verrucomicrobiales bacterium]|nr:MotA/TolQ/ExbB proton channel family protein [Verrucomicrobiales bacterium]